LRCGGPIDGGAVVLREINFLKLRIEIDEAASDPLIEFFGVGAHRRRLSLLAVLP
jgi:hypothetical protein